MKKFFLLAVVAVVAVAIAVPAVAAQNQGDKSFEVIGEVRVRADYTDNASDLDDDDTSGVDDEGLIYPYRVRAGFHANFAHNVSAHVEFQNFGVFGDGVSNGIQPLSGVNDAGDETSMYQGWVELGDIGGTSFDLRLGRMELVMGSEMLMGDNDFYNGINHDGAKASWQYKNWTLDTWFTKVNETIGGFNAGGIFPTGTTSDDADFYGGYATFKHSQAIGFDAYLMSYSNNLAGINGAPSTLPKDKFITVGGRVFNRNNSNWNWNAEIAMQSGDFTVAGAESDISAFAFEGELGYQFEAGIQPRVFIAYNSYSGNEAGTPGDNDAFNPLFQDFHARNGEFDLFRATNLDVIKLGVDWNAEGDRHTFGVDYLMFTMNEEAVGGVAVSEDDLGSEIDLTYSFAYTKHLMLEGAIASFSPGDYFGAAGAATPDSMPGVGATSDDSALRVYANSVLRW